MDRMVKGSLTKSFKVFNEKGIEALSRIMPHLDVNCCTSRMRTPDGKHVFGLMKKTVDTYGKINKEKRGLIYVNDDAALVAEVEKIIQKRIEGFSFA